MTQETIAILGVGVALAAIILHASRDTNRAFADVRRDIAELRRDVAELRERMARLAGLFEGFAGRRPPMAAEQERERAAGRAA